MGRRRLEQGVLIFDYGEAHIRCGGTADKPWFVAKDVCDVLGLANVSQALERLDDDEKGITTVYTLGGKQKAAVVYESGLYALIFTSRKEEAKTFRKWVTSEVLPSLRKAGVYRLKQRQRYQQMGLSPEWIEKREEGIVARKQFTETLQAHGISEGWEYGRITNSLYMPTLGGSAAAVKTRLGLPASANLRDNLPLRELLVLGLAELLAQEKIDKDDSRGALECQRATAIAANNVANAVKLTGRGRELPPA